MLGLTLLGSALAASTGHSAAFERFLDATTAARGTRMCLMPLVEDMLEHRSEMSFAEQREVESFLGPAAHTSMPLRTQGARFVDATPAPPPSTGSKRTTCVPIAEDYGANHLVGDRFTIAWDDGATESQAEDLMEALDASYDREIDELGWKEPIGMDRYNLWVYIDDGDGGSFAAYTWVDTCPSRGYMPYIVVYSDTLDGGTFYQDTAAHEFNHASQFAYGDVYNIDDDWYIYNTYDDWWWEATATWMEEYAYPSHDSWSYSTWGFGNWPEIGMHASSHDSESVLEHMYGMNVWAFYLDEDVGGHELVRGTWEYLLTHRPGLATMPEVLTDMDVDFDETYEGFLATTAVMDFGEHDAFYPVTLTRDVDQLPSTGTPDDALPEGLGQNCIKIESDANPEGKDLQVTFTSDQDVDWYVVLTTTWNSSRVKDYAVATKDSKTGAWTAQLPWDGEQDAYLTVSPNTESLTHEYEYEYTIALFEPPVVDTGDTGIGATDETPSDEHEKKGGGCASANGSASLLLAALSLLAARRRRVTSPA